MAFDYNAARANRFAKRHRKIASKLTGPIESELAKTKEANEALTAANAELEKANAELTAKVAELTAANEALTAANAELEKAKSEAAETPAEAVKPAKAAKKKG